jgi:hypothetical protein
MLENLTLVESQRWLYVLISLGGFFVGCLVTLLLITHVMKYPDGRLKRLLEEHDEEG